MNKIYLFVTLIIAAHCSSSDESSSARSELKKKKKELSEARQKLQEISNQIAELEKEIQHMDSSSLSDQNISLVSVSGIKKEPFEHRIELRGNLMSRKNIQIGAETSGVVENIYVKEGQLVKAGQLLLSINADVLKNTIAEYKTSLELANSIYEKQKALWSQQIGTEVQYLEAKNNKASLERRLATAQSQLKQATVKAPFSGSIESVQVRKGELAMPGKNLIKMASPKDMFIQADVSEKYINKLRMGDGVALSFPSQDQKARSVISAIGQVINNQNRTFEIEVKMPKVNFSVKPNQIVILSVRDYYNQAVWTVPTAMIQQDNNKERFIFSVVIKNGKSIAKKLRIAIGETYQGKTEVLEGLTGNEQIVYRGFRDLTNGNEVTTIKHQPSTIEHQPSTSE